MKNIKRTKTSLFLASILLTVVVSYHIGYKKGAVDGQIKRIPFDLGLYLQMYEMCSYINSSNKCSSVPPYRPDDPKVLIYSTIRFYDATREKFQRIGKNNRRFERNIEEARKIIKDLELVDVGSTLEQKVGSQSEPKNQEAGNPEGS